MRGQTDGAAAVGDAARDRLADPPGGVGGELEALAPVELLDRVDEPEVALLDQVEQRQTGALVPLGDRHHQAEVAVGEGLHGARSPPRRSGGARALGPGCAPQPAASSARASRPASAAWASRTSSSLVSRGWRPMSLEVQTDQVLVGHLRAPAWQWPPFLDARTERSGGRSRRSACSCLRRRSGRFADDARQHQATRRLGRSFSSLCVGYAVLRYRGQFARRRLANTGAGQAHETSHRVGHLFLWTDWSLVSTSAPALAPVRFSDLGVPGRCRRPGADKGSTVPFPIQAATLPDCLAGRDVCGMAPTGSGKTLAFGLAILSRLAATPGARRRGRRHPSALVLVPTRELAAQIEEVIAPLAAAIGARVASIYGGVGYGQAAAALRNGTDVLIACPGRLEDLSSRGWSNLSFVDIVVIDEADRMADMGFLPAVRRLIDKTSASRQTLLFSATLDGPVDKLVRDYQHNPARHEVKPTTAIRATCTTTSGGSNTRTR